MIAFESEFATAASGRYPIPGPTTMAHKVQARLYPVTGALEGGAVKAGPAGEP